MSRGREKAAAVTIDSDALLRQPVSWEGGPRQWIGSEVFVDHTSWKAQAHGHLLSTALIREGQLEVLPRFLVQITNLHVGVLALGDRRLVNILDLSLLTVRLYLEL